MSILLSVLLTLYFSRCEHYVHGFGLLQNVQYSDKCLHVIGSSGDNNGNLEITTCDSSVTDQQLNVEDWTNYGDSPGQIIFQFNKKCLTVNSAGKSNGDIINQYDCWDGASNQLWKVIGSYNGNFQIQNVGSLKCLTAETASIDQWDCLGESAAPHQTWRILKSSDTTYGGQYGVFAFENVQFSGKCLNAVDGVSGTSSNLNIYDCDTSSSSQLFSATNLASIYGSITMYGTNLCLNVYGESQTNGGQVGVYSCSNGNAKNEKWGLRFDESDPTSFQIVSGSSGKCITAESSGTWIDQLDCLSYGSAPHQWWKFKEPSSSPLGLPTQGSLLESVVNPNQCLRIQSRSGENNANMHLMSCNPADSAQVLNMNSLEWDSLSSDPNVISLLSSSKCLTVNGASTENGAVVNQYDCVSPTPGNQKWTLISSNNDGYEELFELQNVGSGKCLTAEGDGSYLDQWDCYHYLEAPHQFWRIRPIAATSSGSHDEEITWWECNMASGLMDAPQYRGMFCGTWCVYKNDADGKKGYSSGYCYTGWSTKRYCTCVTAPALKKTDIQLYKETNYKGTTTNVGNLLYTRADCISFDDEKYKEFDNGALKSVVYEQGVCIRLWEQYKCTGSRDRIFRSEMTDHYDIMDIPNRIFQAKSISRHYC